MTEVSDEEMAYRLVELYVREISKRGEKRQMGLDTIINAYYYTLLRLKKKEEETKIFEEAVEKEEKELTDGVEEITFPDADEQFDFE